MRDYCEEVVLNHSEDGGHVERLLKFAEDEKERRERAGPGGGTNSNSGTCQLLGHATEPPQRATANLWLRGVA